MLRTQEAVLRVTAHYFQQPLHISYFMAFVLSEKSWPLITIMKKRLLGLYNTVPKDLLNYLFPSLQRQTNNARVWIV